MSLVKSGLAESSVRRYRESLSAFFAWAVRERIILVNPVTGTKVPRSSEPRVEMYPFGEADLERVYEKARKRSVRLAEILLIDALDGLAVVGAAGASGP